LSSFFLQAIVSDIPDRPQENTPTHTLQQPNVTTQLQRQVSSMLPPPSRPEGNAPAPASAQQRDITMPTPQHPEQDVLISAQQRGNSVSTTPGHHEENVSNPVEQRKNAVPRRPQQRRVPDLGTVIFTETPGGITEDSPPPSLTRVADTQSESDKSFIALVNLSAPHPMTSIIATPSNVQCYNVGGNSTNCWVFPVNMSQSTIDGRNGSSACTVITMILGSVILNLDLLFPRVGSLSPLRCSVIEKSIRLGNKNYMFKNL
jgi:hypothetical protein